MAKPKNTKKKTVKENKYLVLSCSEKGESLTGDNIEFEGSTEEECFEYIKGNAEDIFSGDVYHYTIVKVVHYVQAIGESSVTIKKV